MSGRPGIVVDEMADSTNTQTTAWEVNPCSWADAARVAEELGMPHVAAMVLVGRGLSDPGAAREFLECSGELPDPFLFSDMRAATRSLNDAITERQRIVVHGDYDADGITATALLVLGFRQLGADVEWYLPSRFKEGYGLSRMAVESIASGGAELLVTVDCGVNYPDEVALARELGLDVIVVDHHEPGPVLPDCHLIHRDRGEYPDEGLCGAGLALKLLHALHMEKGSAEPYRLPEELLEYLDLVAIGTVADLAPLTGENRFYVREGLRLLNRGQRVGLRALCEVSSCTGAVDSGALAFRLAPRLNAAGRVGDPTPPLRLLLTEDETEARTLSTELHQLNGARQDLERGMLESAQRLVTALPRLPDVLVLASPEWHEGVAGIVASRMVELYRRPAVMLCVRDGVAKGSGRSIPAYDLLSGISACADVLTVYGGHAQAAGVTLDAGRVEEFIEALEQHASSVLSPTDLMPRYRADAVLTSQELGADTAKALSLLEPFGNGNPRPRFILVDTLLRDVETTRNGLHLRCRAEVGGVSIPAIGFGMGRNPAEIPADERCVVGAQLRADEWRGSLRAQIILEHVGSIGEDEDVSAGAGMEESCGPGAAFAEETEDCSIDEGGEDAVGETDVVAWPTVARDSRDSPGGLTALAQVLATREPTVILTMSAARAYERLRASLPRAVSDAAEWACITGSGGAGPCDDLAERGVLIAEWGAVSALTSVLAGHRHVIVLDPPFERGQVVAASRLVDGPATLHLLYGDQERRDNASLLRYTTHPRFAMVCLYNAMKSAHGDNDDDVLRKARVLGWEQARVVLSRNALRRAQRVMEELALELSGDGQAKLDVRESAAYREAEAEYEECVTSCLTL